MPDTRFTLDASCAASTKPSHWSCASALTFCHARRVQMNYAPLDLNFWTISRGNATTTSFVQAKKTSFLHKSRIFLSNFSCFFSSPGVHTHSGPLLMKSSNCTDLHRWLRGSNFLRQITRRLDSCTTTIRFPLTSLSTRFPFLSSFHRVINLVPAREELLCSHS